MTLPQQSLLGRADPTEPPAASTMVRTTLSSMVVGNSGRVSFSGLGSGIDFQATVEGLIAAKRIPVDRLEAQITTNQDKIASYQELRRHLTVLQDSLQNLYGAVPVVLSQTIFEAKQTFATPSTTHRQAATNPPNPLPSH